MISARLKENFHNLISSQITECVAKKIKGESTRLLLNLFEVSVKLKLNGYLVTSNTKNALNSFMTETPII